MRGKLISEISKELKTAENLDIQGICKTIYSATGKMTLASLWDHPEEEDSVSVQHFKKRCTQVLDAYLDIYPDVKSCFLDDRREIVDEIYEIYRRNGFFYHSAYRLFPAAPCTSGLKPCVLYRGTPVGEKCFMSGLGLYGVSKDITYSRSVVEMFDMQNQSLYDYLQEVLQGDDWIKIDWPEDAKFLRLEPPFSKGYWKEKPDKTDNISMARYGSPKKIFVFYRWRDECFEQKIIPEWRVVDFKTMEGSGYGEYRRIACGLLATIKQLPPIKVKVNHEHTVNIKIGYRLPPAEEDFFKLYSWPIHYNITQETPKIFQREMSKIVYPVFKQHLESIGYCFVEE